MAEDLNTSTGENLEKEVACVSENIASSSLWIKTAPCDSNGPTEQDPLDDSCDLSAMSKAETSVEILYSSHKENSNGEDMLSKQSMELKERQSACELLPKEFSQNDFHNIMDLHLTNTCVLSCDHSLRYYCRKHKIFCCRVSISQIHRFCENIVYIDEGYVYRYRETDIQDTKKLLSAVDEILEEQITSINEVKRKTKEILIEVQNNIAVNKQQGNGYEDLKEKIYTNRIKAIGVHVNKIVALQKQRKTICECLKTLENFNLPPLPSIIARYKVFSLAEAQGYKSLKTLTSDILEIQMSIHDEFEITRFDVSVEPKKPEVRTFVSLFNETLSRLFKHLFNTCTAQEGREPYPLISCDITFVTSAEKSNIQAGSYTSDGTYLQDNTILFSDRDNKQLIKLDENLGFLEKLQVAGVPRGVCASKDGTQVHVVCDGDKVVTYAWQAPWREVNRFRTERNSLGITCHGNRIVTGHVRGYNHGYVVIYDNTGTEVNRINTTEWSYYPALSHDGKMLYYADGLDAVVCRSMEDVTQVVWRYSSEKLNSPYGIDTDRDCNILIVGWGSHNIHQVSENGKLNRVLVNDMKYIERPCGLFYNKNSNTFVVISKYDKVCVELYRFED